VGLLLLAQRDGMTAAGAERPERVETRIEEDAPTVSVVVCTYTDARWSMLREAVASLASQRRRAEQVVVVVDHCDPLLTRARAEWPDAVIVPNEHGRGLAGARNTALRHVDGDVVAFLDDDAAADPAWLEQLVAAYRDATVVGAGGAVRPRWDREPPSWFPLEFGWVVGCSWTGLPDGPDEVRNPIGAGMSFRRDAVDLAGGFTEGIGRNGPDLMGCEETELSIRIRRMQPDAVVMYLPAAFVRHRVDASRTTWRYFVGRCFAEGRSKALVAARVGARDALRSEREYTRRVLPRGIARGMRDTARGDAAGVLRSLAIVAGVTVTAAGYGSGTARRVLQRRLDHG
jgi:glycosyltransferase involved in cell wall biosynthesis